MKVMILKNGKEFCIEIDNDNFLYCFESDIEECEYLLIGSCTLFSEDLIYDERNNQWVKARVIRCKECLQSTNNWTDNVENIIKSIKIDSEKSTHWKN